ncbi:phosphatidylinositol N-acetylglucosaminyltransferase subunit Y [Sceloporus undulatus]|uniref:phosphatidylinositol N-acetylglucosaminyltransferase subunit Y n=1 Tax=Sceloporus undulatus TaxID=8520 RepID=UPI001C4A9203|nr:phosphatidylinositol N-acetylglucosaminyltransferase subunit Y [Sceloporus undulatus]
MNLRGPRKFSSYERQTQVAKKMFLSLPTMTVLVPLLSLAGLFYSASVDENFPQGCTSTTNLCFYSLLLPVTIPVYVFFHLWTWMGLKLFRHN